MASILICDDNKVFVDFFSEQLSEILNKKMMQFDILTAMSNAELHYFICEQKVQFDIIFMDIEFDGKNGIDITQEINSLYPETIIVYVTAYIEYAESIFKSKFSNFIVKPVTIQKTECVLDNVLSELQKTHARTLYFTNGGNVISVNPLKILYIESYQRKIIIHMSNCEEELYYKISDIECELGNDFFRCHKSFIVNFNHIHKISGDSIILDDGTRVPVAQKRLTKLKNDYLDYISKIG